MSSTRRRHRFLPQPVVQIVGSLLDHARKPNTLRVKCRRKRKDPLAFHSDLRRRRIGSYPRGRTFCLLMPLDKAQVETTEEYLDRKRKEIALLNKCLAQPLCLEPPQSPNDVVEQNCSLRRRFGLSTTLVTGERQRHRGRTGHVSRVHSSSAMITSAGTSA